jgi:hypothetical protein
MSDRVTILFWHSSCKRATPERAAKKDRAPSLSFLLKTREGKYNAWLSTELR